MPSGDFWFFLSPLPYRTAMPFPALPCARKGRLPSLEDPATLDEVILPIRHAVDIRDANLAFRGGSVDHLIPADIDPDMTLIADDIALFQVAHLGDDRVLGRRLPAR